MLFSGTDSTPCYKVYCFDSEEALKNFKGGSPGDIAIVDIYGGQKTTYVFDITHKWVKTTNPTTEAAKIINECPTCGAHRFIRKDNNNYQCEYCNNIYEV